MASARQLANTIEGTHGFEDSVLMRVRFAERGLCETL